MIAQALRLLAQGKETSPATRPTRRWSRSSQAKATPVQIAGFLTALRMKGESVEEITACARVMREKVTRITTKHPVILDTCGNGG